jgi:hypothetical protein
MQHHPVMVDLAQSDALVLLVVPRRLHLLVALADSPL